MEFVKFGCGCIGFSSGDTRIIVNKCDRDSVSDMRDWSEDDVIFLDRPLTSEQVDSAKPLTAEESKVWLDRIRKQLWDGIALRDIKSLLNR